MDKRDIDRHIDAKLGLLVVDNIRDGEQKAFSRRDLAEKIGISSDELGLIESEIMKKLKLHPSAYEAATLPYRTHKGL